MQVFIYFILFYFHLCKSCLLSLTNCMNVEGKILHSTQQIMVALNCKCTFVIFMCPLVSEAAQNVKSAWMSVLN